MSFSTQGLTDSEKDIVRRIGTAEAPLAVRLHQHMVESCSAVDGVYKLTIHVPEPLREQDDQTIRQWAQNFFREGFGTSGVAVGRPSKENSRLEVTLSDSALERYKAMTRDVDLTIEAMGKAGGRTV